MRCSLVPHFVRSTTPTFNTPSLLRACVSLCRHPWETVWWEWMFNLRGLLYYSYDKANTYTQSVYLLGA